jgi:hypothetical protein
LKIWSWILKKYKQLKFDKYFPAVKNIGGYKIEAHEEHGIDHARQFRFHSVIDQAIYKVIVECFCPESCDVKDQSENVC